MEFMVVTEIIENGNTERWYYGTYSEARANEVALELGNDYDEGIFHVVIRADQADAFKVNNLPD